MIRTIVKPSKQSISIDLPKEFIGKQVEVIAFTIEEALDKPLVADKPLTHFAAERVLAKEWLTQDEEQAWQDL
jgi:hypothetical protein